MIHVNQLEHLAYIRLSMDTKSLSIFNPPLSASRKTLTDPFGIQSSTLAVHHTTKL